MSASLAKHITCALGGDWHGNSGNFPAPGHSRKDRSVSIVDHHSDPNDVVVFTFGPETYKDIKDDLRRRGLLPKRSGRRVPQIPQSPIQTVPRAAVEFEEVRKSLDLAYWLWERSQPIAGTLAERYLCKKRRITVSLPATLRFLPASGKHPPSLIGAFGLADEPEPGVLRINTLRGVHLTKLRPDGLDKADTEPNKIMLGRAHTLPIVLAPVNDIGGLTITEGIEEALAVHEVRGLGAWAAGSASRLPGLAEHVPAYVECVTVLIDPDPAGERYGNTLVERLERRGFEVIAMPVRDFKAALRLRETRHGI
ncbi:DUF7146 domain-containing protein [Microvirga aerophila]|uniref:Uncharacterized protein n=1 Tax=Microvirga aerophila TaxID=670291 RepID=A0A512C2L8_9HYPH|nr:toprim domain-containing protein [Microvirga aerophila]GEO18458.1 hypothetical protein MAE02_61540 [Microvirga aerophila]